MNRRSRYTFGAALGALSLATGCSTPQSARDLAAQGVLVMDQAHSEVQGLVDRATLIYRAREGVVRDLARSDISDGARIGFLGAVRVEAGGEGVDNRRSESIKRIVALSRDTREKLQADLAARAAAIDSVFGEPVPVPAEKLGAAKLAMAMLAQELTTDEWLRFSWHYARDVRNVVQNLKADAPASAASAP